MKPKNILRCPNCGFAVKTEAFKRQCAKCNAKMKIEFVGEDKNGSIK